MIHVPDDVTIKHGSFSAKLKFRKLYQPTLNNAYKQAQKFVDNEVLRLSDPLTPMRNKQLIKSGHTSTRRGSGEVRYRAPHARYHYYGKLMVGRAPKKLTNIDMTYQGGPTRGPKWFDRMKARHKTEILKGAMKVVLQHKN